MSEQLTIKEIEVARDIPGNPQEKGGPAKVLRYILEGDDRTPEEFTTARTKMRSVGDSVDESDLTFNQQWNRWEFKKKDGAGGGGGYKKSPEGERRMNRASAQKQACQIVRALGRVPSEQEMINLINWFEDDIYGKLKSGTNAWPMNSDVPADMSGTPFE